jgi:hypothetical protein
MPLRTIFRIHRVFLLGCIIVVCSLFFTSVNISCGTVKSADAQSSCDCVPFADMVSALDARIKALEALEARVKGLETALATVGLPHNPELVTADGRLPPLVVSTANSGGGSVGYTGGDSAWLEGRLVKLASFDSGSLEVNATYHLRLSRDGDSWTWAALKVPYRVPGSAAMTMPTVESDPRYDSTAQSMLAARIVTGEVNTSATVTMLANQQTLAVDGTAPGGSCFATSEQRSIQTDLKLSWARTPRGIAAVFGPSADDTWLQGYSNSMSLTRYTATINSNYHTENGGCLGTDEVYHRYLLVAP